LVEKLESSLDFAVQQERYQEASALRDELSRMHMDDTSAVLKTNSDFYDAFSSKNLELMRRVWHNSPHVECIHPGAKPLLGYEDIVNMWKNMFQARDKVFKSTVIVPSNVKVYVRGTSAFVTCTEEVSAPGAERRMLATNVFRKYNSAWFLVHHHASQAFSRASNSNPLDDLLNAPSSARGVIRIDGTMSGSQGNAQDIVDEIVRALQGALEDEKGSLPGAMDIGQSGLSGMMYIEEEESSEDESRKESEVGANVGRSEVVLREAGDLASSMAPNDDQLILHERELMEGVTERTVEAVRKLARDGKLSRDAKRKLLTDIIEHHQEGESASEVEIAFELLVMRFLRPDGADSAQEADLLEDFAEQCKILASKLH